MYMPPISLSKVDLDYEMGVIHVYIYQYWVLFKITWENVHLECYFYKRILSWCGNSLDPVLLYSQHYYTDIFFCFSCSNKTKKNCFFIFVPVYLFVCIFTLEEILATHTQTHTQPLGQVRESPAVPTYSGLKHLYS